MRLDNLASLFGVVLACGTFLQGAFTALYAIAARVYPMELRATGIGWGSGIGRIGAILSPVLTAFLITAGWNLYSLFAALAAPVLIAAVLVMRLRV